MQQRRLRLGDILDDYCPRERRITNHAVVAMIEDEIRLTRCTTCDTEHEYKQAKAPVLRRKKDPAAAAYKEVLAEVTGELPFATPRPERVERPRVEAVEPAASEALAPSPVPMSQEPAVPSAPEAAGMPENGDSPDTQQPEAARVHRRLIRATLPRIESQVAPRPIPQFTMRQPTGRPGKFRGAQGRGGPGGPRQAAGGRSGNGNTASRSPFPRGAGRPDGQRQPRRGKKHSK